MLSRGVVGYFLHWLHLTFPSTALHSFLVTPLPILPPLRPAAAQTETAPCRAALFVVWSKFPAQDLPRGGNLGVSVSALALKHPSHRREGSAGVTCKVLPTLCAQHS